jgi:hypothetical protein
MCRLSLFERTVHATESQRNTYYRAGSLTASSEDVSAGNTPVPAHRTAADVACWSLIRLAKEVQLVDPTIRGVINYQMVSTILESWSPPVSLSGPWFPLGSSQIPSDPVRTQIPSDPPI